MAVALEDFLETLSLEDDKKAKFAMYVQALRYCNTVGLDTYRYAYGRGVLMRFSNIGFVIMLLKDITYNIWHFGTY
jgi:hypothetical protein